MSGRRILIADSGETSRKNIERQLARMGHKTFSASDGSGAVRIARTIRPDLVLLDVDLWGQNAYDVAGIIENDSLSLVVFLCSRPTQAFFSRLRESRLRSYLPKPFTAEELQRTVTASLQTGDLMREYQRRISGLEREIENRRILDKAKLSLMESEGLTEEEAYQKLRKKSMDLSLPIHEAAALILSEKS